MLRPLLSLLPRLLVCLRLAMFLFSGDALLSFVHGACLGLRSPPRVGCPILAPKLARTSFCFFPKLGLHIAVFTFLLVYGRWSNED